MYSPTKEEAERLSAKGHGAIPVSRTILADVRTPIEVLNALLRIDSHCYILESIEDRQRWGRYTFLGFDPLLDIVCSEGTVTVSSDEGEEVIPDEHPTDVIRDVLSRYRSPRMEDMPPFTGGLVGYFAYDYIKYAEPSLRINSGDDEGFKDADLMLFDKVIAFDNFRQTITVIANILPGRRDYAEACAIIDSVVEIIKNGKPREHVPVRLGSDFTPLFSEEQYRSMVVRAKEHIREGDIFQVVLSNRLEAEMDGSLLDVYRVLRTTNPSPFMFYFSGSDIEVAGASPETLVKLRDGVLHTFPLAGTRPRGSTSEEDAEFERDLLSDQKELAEHNMLVDLGRNDIGKVSGFGTVEVERYLEIERFSHVMHIGSTVRGEIRRVHRPRGDPRRHGRHGRRRGGASSGYTLRGAEAQGVRHNRRARGLQARHLRRGHRVYRPDGQHGRLHRHQDRLPQEREGVREIRRRDRRHKARAVTEAVRRAAGGLE